MIEWIKVIVAFPPCSSCFICTHRCPGQVRVWELQRPYSNQVTAVPKAQINHDAPVLCTDFSSDGSTVFSGGANKQVGYGVRT